MKALVFKLHIKIRPLKKALTFCIALAFSLLSYQSFAQSENPPAPPSPLPPAKELPKKDEVKTFYDLGGVYDYELFEVTGKKISTGTAQHVDVSELKKGSYFFAFNGQKVAYKKD